MSARPQFIRWPDFIIFGLLFLPRVSFVFVCVAAYHGGLLLLSPSKFFMQDRRVTLCVPGLFASQKTLHTPAVLDDLQTAGLDQFISRAYRQPAHIEGFVPLLFHLFSLPDDRSQDLPVAAITRLQSRKPSDKHFYLCADPVQLKADRDHLVMLGNHHLAIQMEEAKQLVEEFNVFFAEDGFQLEVLAADRWCLRVEKTPQIKTTALADVMGQNIDPHLPRGDDALQWHRFLNEVQMLFHNSPVNQARLAQGQTSINSVWLWGGGVLPKTNSSSSWQGVWSNEAIAPALALHAGITWGAASAEACLTQMTLGRHLVVLDGGATALQRGDIGAWRDFIEELNHDWIEPLLAMLKTGQLAELQLQTAAGETFLLTARGLRRWWRRCQPFINFGSA